MIMVRKLTMEVIEEAIQAYVTHKEAYWLRLYHFSLFIEPSMFGKLEKAEDAGFIELDELDNECKNL